MTLLERIEKEIPEAMRAKKTLRLETLRSIKNALSMPTHAGVVVTVDKEAQILKTMFKQRHESAAIFRKAGREEMAFKEELEGVIIKQFLPEEASREEIVVVVDEVVVGMLAEGPLTIKKMGEIMRRVGIKLGKPADGKTVSDLVKSRL